MHKITNKENLIRELDVLRNLLAEKENEDHKAIVESMFCVQQMITRELIDRLCKKNVFESLTN